MASNEGEETALLGRKGVAGGGFLLVQPGLEALTCGSGSERYSENEVSWEEHLAPDC